MQSAMWKKYNLKNIYFIRIICGIRWQSYKSQKLYESARNSCNKLYCKNVLIILQNILLQFTSWTSKVLFCKKIYFLYKQIAYHMEILPTTEQWNNDFNVKAVKYLVSFCCFFWNRMSEVWESNFLLCFRRVLS